jgi:cytochrome c556
MRATVTILVLAGMTLCAAWAFAQSKAPKPKRVAPPKFTKTDPFFEDAFKDALVGERPADLSKVAAAVAATSSSAATGAVVTAAPTAGGSGWSQFISATTIEDTIKSLKLQVDKEITTPSDFAGKGHKLARRDYTLLATLFGIAGEYDGDVRWKKDAPAARDAFARSAANFKVGTAQAFQEAKLRKDELSELVGGSSPYAGKEADTKAAWPTVAGRAPLMQFLETAWDPRLKPGLADKGQFAAKIDAIVKDAELFAAIGEVLAKEGMPDADSDEYKAFSHRLRDGSKQILDAVKLKNYEQAASASAAIGKACAECHESYRS